MSSDEALGPDPTTQALLRLIPKVGSVVATWRQETFERQQRRIEQLGIAAAEDLGAEALFEQIAASERLTDMFNAAVEAAVATGSEAKIRLLGRALSSGATAEDEAKVDEAEQLLRIAAELDPVDLRALRALERRSTSSPSRKIMFALGISAATAGPIIARLERLHLLQAERSAVLNDKADPDDDSVNMDESWEVTETANELLDLLRNRVRPSPTDSGHQAVGSAWEGFSDAQAELLNAIDDLRVYSWMAPRTDQLPHLLGKLEAHNVPYDRVRQALRSIGYEERELQAFDRWADRA